MAIEQGYPPAMALEVRELIIRVTVQDEAAPPAPTGRGAASLAAADLQRLREAPTQTCVRQVLAEFQRRREP